ncbi:MAG TPA: hypothetical protein GXX56_03440 [Rhodocyclaceae bacterium]|nr:hypothetical protein [Rhodocyclaceae bacterium]
MAIYEIPEIETPDDNLFGSLRFVIHVLRRPKGVYFPRVFRKELVEVVPVYYQNANERLIDKATVEVAVRDDSCDWESFECISEKDTVERVFEKFNWLFTHEKNGAE